MKKTNKFIVLLFFAVFTFTSCEDELEIISEDDVSPEVAFSNATTVEGLILGLYSQAQSADAFNGTPQVLSEWWADNSNFVGSFPTFRAVEDYATQADNTSINAFWFQHLDVIEAANFVINNLPEAEVARLEEETKTQYLAEARFLRALTMFDMTQYFGQPFQCGEGETLSIPIVLEDFRGDNVEDFLGPRNTLNEVYAQIADDLDFAMANLPATYGNNDDTRGRATSGAATALYSRLELYRENYEEAARLATEVISSPTYVLATDYAFYNGLTSEAIFSIINIPIDSQNSNEGFSGLTNPTPEGRGDAPFSDDLIAAYEEEEGDRRFTELTQIGTDAEGDTTAVFTTKFDDGITQADNAPVLRVTEMYLIRAEANLMANTEIGAAPIEDINRLRTRAGLPPLENLTIDDILRERRKELAFEGGFRRIDLLRNGRALRGAGMENADVAGACDDLTIFPIPTSQLDLNPNLVQNPGY